jgi:hypothetical protein
MEKPGRDPEIDAVMKQAFIDTELRHTASELWVPTDKPHSFTFDHSAAGRKLNALLPPNQHVQDASQLVIDVQDISRRMHHALYAAVGDYKFTSAAEFTIFDPQEAGHLKNPGVSYMLGEVDGSAHSSGVMSYRDFYEFMQRAGICEKASPAQRLGRCVLDGIGAWMEDEAKIRGATRYPHPPSFGAW